ncbi:MAG: hypothetical protein RLZ14_602 [Actinomycetota bacterium]
MAILRVRKGINSVVTLPSGEVVHLREDAAFDSDDPVVAEVCAVTATQPADWFASDAGGEEPRRRSRVEKATAAPGEWR